MKMIKNKKILVMSVVIIFLIVIITLILVIGNNDKHSGNDPKNKYLEEVYLDEIEAEDGLEEVENEDADIETDEKTDIEDKTVEQGLPFVPSEPNLDEDSENKENADAKEENQDDSLEQDTGGQDTGKFGRFF